MTSTTPASTAPTSTALTSTALTSTAPAPAPMSRRQVLEALSGLLLGMLTTILSMTVVGTALPVIVSDLDGTQSAYTWVVTASLLAMTVSTPLWGKLADLLDRKLLIQLALAAFVVASAVAGLSQEVWHLIAARVVQGVAAGGLMALSMVVITDIISPRERGRYVGIMGAVMSIGTLGGRCSAASSPTRWAGAGRSTSASRWRPWRSSCCSAPCTCRRRRVAACASTTWAPS